MNGNGATKKPLSRKPSLTKSRKPPEIRHTLTSKYRMLKANPLLLSELEQAARASATLPQESLDKPLKTLASIFDANTAKAQFRPSQKAPNRPPRKIELYSRGRKVERLDTSSRIDFGSGKILSSTVLGSTRKGGMRRSLSAENFAEKRAPNRLKPASSLEKLQNTQQKRERANNHSIIAEESTPNTRKSLFPNTPKPEEMLDRLDTWLKRKGKSLGDYRHLKCFGGAKQGPPRSEEDKENVPVVITASSSYEDLKIDQNLEDVAKESLQDLHKLILNGYPNEQCEIWLRVIKNKYRQLEEEPQYWECRAALEQGKGNINVAVECYKTAIVQGAEVKSVDKSLDQLLQKFSLLDINHDANEPNKDRTRIVEDARNIFKSSIIKFAVQERLLKKKFNENGISVVEKKLYVTPVRRSTRLSRSRYTSTPGIKVYSTLLEAENNTNDQIKFQTNTALKD